MVTSKVQMGMPRRQGGKARRGPGHQWIDPFARQYEEYGHAQ